jgi:PAS domain S-box-containing protein
MDAVDRAAHVFTRRDTHLSSANAPALAYALAVVVSVAAVAVTVWTPLLHARPWLVAAGAIALSAWLGGFGPALLSTALTFVAINVFLGRMLQWGTQQVAGGLVLLGVGLLMALAARAMARSQREAWRQSQHLQAMFRQAAVGIAHVALDGRLLRVNHRLATIVDRTTEAVQTLRCDDLLHEEDATLLHATFAEIARGERTELAKDLRCCRPDGSIVWVHSTVAPLVGDDGKPESLIAVIEDIHERHMAEERALLHEERARLALDIARLGTWSWSADTAAVEADKRSREICGLPPAGAVDLHDVGNRVHREDWTRVRDTARRAFETGSPFAEEFRFVHPGGSIRWVVVRGRVVRASQTRTPLMLGSVLDVTARRTAEEALRMADRQKDDFLALLSHELRNPLAPIRTAVHLLKLRHGHDPDVQRLHAVIERQVQHLVRLVDDLLDVSRVLRGKIELRPETLDVADVVAMAVETTRPTIDAQRQQLQLELPPSPLYVHGDQVRLAQVIGNLLHNASKFSDRGSRVGLTVERRDGHVMIHVRDSGTGIAPEMLPMIFEPFVQADRSLERSQGGLGIGLTLVRKIIELHGGTVAAISEGLARGSEFVVGLPSVSAPERLGAVQPIPAPALRQGLRVLVVDDNIDAAESLAALLKLRGLVVSVAHNGQDALAQALQQRPDVVLLDIGLPGMNGYEVAAALRRNAGRGPALIAITGYGQDADARRAAEAGFDRHLVKPVDAGELELVLAAVTN